MNAKRWSLAAAFAAGSLTSAMFIGWDWGSRSEARSTGGHQVLGALPVGVLEPRQPRDVSEHGQASPVSAPRYGAPVEGESPERTEAQAITDAAHEGEKSVADVLAHLEAEYRRNSAPAGTPEAIAHAESPVAAHAESPVAAHAESPVAAHAESPVAAHAESPVEAHAESPVEAHAESPVEAHAESPVEAHAESPVEAHAESPVEAHAESPVAAHAESPSGSETASPAQPSPVPSPSSPGTALDPSILLAQQQASANQQQQVAALQQVAIFQQAALAQQVALTQQVVMLQYLQLVSQGANPRLGAPVQTPRRPSGGRIVDTLPSTFSATDNPWGFTYPPLVVR